MKYILPLLLLCLHSIAGFSQDNTYALSEPIALPQEGWNKVLLLKNGNTLLFHFENRKGIVVKVFDSTHKEIASQKHLCNVIDINGLDRAEIKGIYEVNGEAVLFVAQDIENKGTLARLRIDGATGRLVEEVKMLQSPSFSNRTIFTVLKAPNADDYSVLCFKKLDLYPKEPVKLIRYDNTHKITAEIPLPTFADSFDAVHFVDADIDRNGSVCVTTCLSTIISYPKVMGRKLAVYYLPQGATGFTVVKANLPNNANPYYTQYAYNPYAKNLNLLMVNDFSGIAENGLERKFVSYYESILLALNAQSLNLQAAELIANEKVNKYLHEKVDTLKKFYAPPLFMHTNNNGLTTVVFEESDRYNAHVGGANIDYTHLGNIGITQFDDNGKEIWGAMLFKCQLVNSPIHPSALGAHGRDKALFRNKIDQDYLSQFGSVDFVSSNRNQYLIYNDANKNFGEIVYTSDSVYRFDYTNTSCYKINRKKEIKRICLFGTPGQDESKYSFIESADYDEQKNLYATLMVHRKGTAYTTHLAWCKLEE